MTNDKVNAVLKKYADNLTKRRFTPQRTDTSRAGVSSWQRLEHVLWMALEAQQLPPEKLEKKMRWLGFIQGVLWTSDGASIDELKKDNAPDEVT